MRLPLLISLFALLAGAQDITFINPGPAGANSVYTDDPSFAYGSNIDIQWTPNNYSISLVLVQQTENAAFEYVFQNQAGFSSYNWNVATAKSLEVSRIFFFQIFITGQTGPTATSHYFNITGNAGGTTTAISFTTPLSTTSPPTSTMSSATTSTTSPPTSTMPSATTSTSSPTSSQLSTAASTTTSSSSPTPTAAPGGGGLSTGAKVGIGVGVPLAVIAGLLVGWLIFGRRNKSRNANETQYAQSQPPKQNNYDTGNMKQYHDSAVMNIPQELDGAIPGQVPAELYNQHYDR